MNALENSIYKFEDLSNEVRNIYALADILMLAVENPVNKANDEQYYLVISALAGLLENLKDSFEQEVTSAFEVMRRENK